MTNPSVAHIIEISEGVDGATLSGAENHVSALAAGQASRGARVRLYALVGRPGANVDAWGRTLQSAGVEVEFIGPRKRYGLVRRRILRLAGVVRLAQCLRSERPDVVHTHLLFASQLGRVAAFLAGRRVVVESTHCDEPLYRKRWLRARLRLLDRVTTRHVAISEHVKDHLIETLGIDPQRIDVVRYGIDPPPHDEPGREEVRAGLGINQNAFVACFVGRLAPQKNVELFIGAIGQLPEVVGLVVGAGPLESELRALAHHRAPNIRFLGFRSDAGAIVASSDVLCLPSRWEGLGLVLLEAMVRGVLTVGSRAGAIPEVLGQGQFGLVMDRDDESALVRAIEWIQSNPSEAASLARRGHQHALSTLTVEAMVEATSAVYETALATARHAGSRGS